MTARYALYPGPVRSRVDGDRHFVSALALARLYAVALADCVVIQDADYRCPSRRSAVAHAASLIPLYPRADGRYELPPAPAGHPRPSQSSFLL